MKIIFTVFLFICTLNLFSEEYTIRDEFEKDHLGRINVIKRFVRMHSDEVLHREKARMILYKETNNIFQFWGGHIDVLIQGVGKVDYVNNLGKYARKYSEDAVIYGLSKQFSKLYFYDNEINISIEASDLFPEFDRRERNTHQPSEADLKLKDVIKNSSLESEKKLKILHDQCEERKQQQIANDRKAEELQKQLEKRYRNSGSILNVLKGLIYD